MWHVLILSKLVFKAYFFKIVVFIAQNIRSWMFWMFPKFKVQCCYYFPKARKLMKLQMLQLHFNMLMKSQGWTSSLETTCLCSSVVRIAGQLAYWYLHFSKLYFRYQEAINREYKIRFSFVIVASHVSYGINVTYCSF